MNDNVNKCIFFEALISGNIKAKIQQNSYTISTSIKII